MSRIDTHPLDPALLRLRGISPKQIKEHYKLYEGYVKTINEIRSRLQQVDRRDQNPRYTPYRGLKVEEPFNINGVVLHELYFENLGGTGRPHGPIVDALKKNFGSYEAWEADFKAAAGASRGWVLLSLDFRDNKLHNYLADAHDKGIVDCATTLLIIDMYEHAYFLDYGTERERYIDAFMKNIDWDVVNRRYQSLIGWVDKLNSSDQSTEDYYFE
ncbi:superoxide dismutase [Heliorestis acidaminivorans]|uniref:superoxide dismutase n=1 Tax=Heliorestis acidaminivorans TaxID=553427 RepID=A0A6I0F6T5_9FIRM|nr:Fe-Mn family superoxide dismutase [Heliorestis acidaminivorans]KAB2954547.1 superoxide dismutase [Heliorestis acidaminivorans]